MGSFKNNYFQFPRGKDHFNQKTALQSAPYKDAKITGFSISLFLTLS
jgi:hypothetical protein